MQNSSAVVVLLAAGQSTRTGSVPKPLLRVGQKTWLEEQLHALVKIQKKSQSVSGVVVVLGYHFERIVSELPWLQNALYSVSQYEGLSLKVVKNPNPENGSFSSLMTALKSTKEVDVFVLPIDVEVPSSEVFESLIRSSDTKLCVVPTYADKGGHPVWLSQIFQKQLLQQPQNSRLDHEIHGLPKDQMVRVSVSDARVLTNKNHKNNY